MADRYTTIRTESIKDRSVKKGDLDATGETTGYVLTVQSDGSVDWEASSGGGGSTSTYKQTFVNGDLTSSKITIEHNLDTEHPVVIVYDGDDEEMFPTFVRYLTTNTIELDFTDMPALTGTYKVRVIGAGAVTGQYIQSFTSADLTAGKITFTHYLGQKQVFFSVRDNSDDFVMPTNVRFVDTNNLELDLSTLTVTGTWYILLSPGGAGSGGGTSLSDSDADTKIQVEESADEDVIRFDVAGTQEAQMDANGLTLKSGASVNEFSTDGTMAGDSDDAVPTEKAVKTFLSNNYATDVQRKKNESNILINAFRIAVNGALSVQKMIDGIVDEYEDETGIDTANSTNESYDSTNDLYEPSKSPVDSFTDSLFTGGSGWQGYTFRQILSAGSLTQSGNRIRVTLESRSTSPTLNIDNVAIVERSGSTANGTTTPTEILFSGGSGVSIPGSSSTVVSDWLEFTIDETKDYLIIFDLSSSGDMHIGQATSGGDGFYSKSASNSYNTQNLSGASFTANNTTTIVKLEVEQANIMALISDTFTAEAQPDSGRIVLLEEDVDTITLNTDLKAYASRDGGSSWVEGTLADEGDYDTSKRILVADFDFTASGVGTGTSMEYKLVTANNKDLRLYASGLTWN